MRLSSTQSANNYIVDKSTLQPVVPSYRSNLGQGISTAIMAAGAAVLFNYCAEEIKLPAGSKAPMLEIVVPTWVKHTSLEDYHSSNTQEYYKFIKRDEVSKFIEAKESTRLLLKALPALISEYFGQVEVTLDIYQDYEEGWKNLRIIIGSSSFDKEEKLLTAITEDDELRPSLNDIILSLE